MTLLSTNPSMTHEPTPQNARQKRILAFCIFALAFLLRVLFAFQWQHMPYGDAPLLDARVYDDWALALQSGQPISRHAFYQSPLYPYLLACLYSVTGHSYLAASLLNAFVDSCSAALLSLISFSLFGRMAGIVTGLLAATYAPMIFYTAPLMKESLALLLLTAFLFMALRALRDNRLCDYALCGLACGLAIVARGNALFLLPVVPAFAWMQCRRAALRGIALFFLTAFIAVLPTTWHNYSAAHDFVPLTYDAGFNLYIGHSPYANGANAYPPEISTDPEQERLETAWAAEQGAGRHLSPSGISAYWRDKAVDFAFAHPGREIQLLGLKLFAFWNDADSFDNYDAGFIKQNFPSLLNLPLARFWLVATLAAFAVAGGGWIFKQQRSSSLLLLTCAFFYMSSVVIFYVTDRYRLPIAIFLLPLAGAAAPCACILWSQEKKKSLLVSSGTALLFLLVALWPPLTTDDLTAFDWGTLTTIYADKGDKEQALDAFQKGSALSATRVGSQAYIRAAEMHELAHQQDQAAQLFQQAAQLFPQDGVVLYNLGRLQAMQGHWDDAITTLHQAIERAPTYGLSYFALASIYAKQGDMQDARAALHKGLAADPEEPHLLSLEEIWQPRP